MQHYSSVVPASADIVILDAHISQIFVYIQLVYLGWARGCILFLLFQESNSNASKGKAIFHHNDLTNLS